MKNIKFAEPGSTQLVESIKYWMCRELVKRLCKEPTWMGRVDGIVLPFVYISTILTIALWQISTTTL